MRYQLYALFGVRNMGLCAAMFTPRFFFVLGMILRGLQRGHLPEDKRDNVPVPPPPSLFFLTTLFPLFKGRYPVLNIFGGLCFGLGGGLIALGARVERFYCFCATLLPNGIESAIYVKS